nr:uncharacterized protein LOC131774259 [Pocillopora verrucosa]
MEQLRWTSGDLDGEAHGTGDLEIVEWTGFRGIKESVEVSYSFDEEDLHETLRKLAVAMPDEEGMAAMLSEESVSSGLAGSTGPTSGSSQLPVFLSYQHKSKEQVKVIKKALETVGLSCWMDESSIRLGEKLTQKIENGIRECKVFISCVTKDYCVSEMCRREASLARESRVSGCLAHKIRNILSKKCFLLTQIHSGSGCF